MDKYLILGRAGSKLTSFLFYGNYRAFSLLLWTMGVHIGHVCIRWNCFTNLIDLHSSCFVLLGFLYVCLAVVWGYFLTQNTQHNNSIPWKSIQHYLYHSEFDVVHIREINNDK